MWRILSLIGALTFAGEVCGDIVPEESGRWQPGPWIGSLAGIAEVVVPGGFSVLEREQYTASADGAALGPLGLDVGRVRKAGAGWEVDFIYDPIGHVVVAAVPGFDTRLLMDAIQRRDRSLVRRPGADGFRCTGWASKPSFDQSAHCLEWALDGSMAGQSRVQVNSRLLGRYGVLRVVLVVSPELLETALPEYRRLVSGLSFRAGQRYEDFISGEPRAAGDLHAFIAGAHVSVAEQRGVPKWPMWVIGISLSLSGGILASLRGSKPGQTSALSPSVSRT